MFWEEYIMETVDKLHYLYIITNETKGLQYVGVSCTPKIRIAVHLGGRGNKGIAKHIGDKFTSKILCIGSQCYIYSLENKCIEVYNTMNPNGYNVATGGALGGGLSGIKNGMAILDESAILEIRNKYNSGSLQVDLAIEYAVTPTTISHIIRGKTWESVGGPIQINKSNEKLSQEKIDKIIELRSQNLTFEKIAEIVGVSDRTCSNYIKSNPNNKFKATRVSQETIDEIVLLRSRGLSYDKIAKIVGFSKFTCHKYAKGANG